MMALFENEFRALRESPGAILALLLTSFIVVGLTSDLWHKPPALRVAILNPTAACADEAMLRTLVSDGVDFALTDISQDAVTGSTVWRAMDRNHLALLLTCGDTRGGLWIAYLAPHSDTDLERAQSGLKLVEVGLGKKMPWYLPPPIKPLRVAVQKSESCSNGDAMMAFFQADDAYEIAEAGAGDPQAVADRSKLDLYLACSATKAWQAFSGRGTDAKRAGATLARLAQETNVPIQWSISPGHPSPADTTPTSAIDLHVRASLTNEGSIWLLPGISLMVSMLLSFYLAATSVVREVRLGTWNNLRLAPGTSPLGVLASKALLPFLAGLATLAVYTTFHTVFGLSVKPQMAELTLAIYLPALLAATLQGLSVSSLVRRESGAQFGAAAYLVSMFMFSGIIVPPDLSGQTVRSVGALFPLSFAREPVQAVVLNGADLWNFTADLEGLWINLAVSMAIAVCCIHWRWHSE